MNGQAGAEIEITANQISGAVERFRLERAESRRMLTDIDDFDLAELLASLGLKISSEVKYLQRDGNT